MRNRALPALVALAVIAFLAVQPAEAKIRFHYSSGHWSIHGSFGGYPAYWYLPGYRYYSPPAYRYYVPRYSVLPVLSIGRLPYIPPGTIYSVDSSAYRSYRYYGYPYDYAYGPWPGTSFAGAYLATAPGAGTTTQAAAPTVLPPAQPVQNTVNVVVQVTPQEGRGTNVTARTGAWDDKLWRISLDGSPRRAAQTSTPGTDGAPPREPSAERADKDNSRTYPAPMADTQPSYLSALERGDDSQRLKAAEELKRFNTPAAVEALVDALRKDGAPPVRKAAAESLGAMLAYKARAALWQAAREDDDAGVRKAARDAALKIEAYYDVKR